MSNNLSSKQLSVIIFYWLSIDFNEKEIKKKSKLFGYKIKNNKDLDKFFFELLMLNMWIIENICEGLFTDTEKNYDVLERFHQYVYDSCVDKKIYSYKDWVILTTSLFIDYDEAMRTEHPSSSLWVVANVFNERLFGEINKDLGIQLKMMSHIGLYMESLGKFLIDIKEKYGLE